MKTNRRLFLTGASAAAMATLATSAVAQDVIRDLLNSTKRGTWNNQFDARATTKGEVASYQPILGPETVSYVQTAIEQYRAIVAAGGWPMVPATKKLELGVVDKDVEVLRRRLMISGDLSQNAISLGWDEVRLPHPVFDGDTLYARSEVLSKRESKSQPARGIVQVRTTGFNQEGVIVIEFRRTLMVYKRAHAPQPGTMPDFLVAGQDDGASGSAL